MTDGIQRRTLLRASLIGGGMGLGVLPEALAGGAAVNPALPLGTRDEAVLEALPDKKPLIKLSYRPPNYETPLAALRGPITANDAFFVRYHLAGLPDKASLDRNWALTIDGDAAAQKVKLSLADLQRLPQHEIAAVCQCSGNRRGLSNPHVAGVEWGVGAMGCAVWRGPRLKDVLALAGVQQEAKEIGLRGADEALMDATPAFIKSMPVDRAFAPSTIVALSMNGEALPIWNGYPVRLVVAGWTATYWLKHLTHLEIRRSKVDNFWMSTAYRVPTGMFPGSAFPTQDNDKTRPITDIVINSLATSHLGGEQVKGAGFTVSGLAWNNGAGIARVEISTDDGQNWKTATLGASLGDFAFRPWSKSLTAPPGPVTVRIRATSRDGSIQPEKAIFNGSGYHHNAIQALSLTAV